MTGMAVTRVQNVTISGDSAWLDPENILNWRHMTEFDSNDV